jgi:hypothetical protein
MRKYFFALLLTALFATSLFATVVSTKYRATNQTITITLNSLANSTTQSTGIRGSALIDNTSNNDLDDQVTVKVKTGASSTSSTGTVVIYLYGCVGGSTTCTDSVTGTDAGQTLTNPTNLIKVQACNTVANATTYICGPFSVANSFGGTVPARWGVVIQNLSGATLDTTAGNFAVVYDAIQLNNQ